MWPRKKGTPQTVTGTDKEWSQTGTLVHKPARGWLHSDETIVDGGGVCYCVQVSCQYSCITSCAIIIINHQVSFSSACPLPGDQLSFCTEWSNCDEVCVGLLLWHKTSEGASVYW